MQNHLSETYRQVLHMDSFYVSQGQCQQGQGVPMVIVLMTPMKNMISYALTETMLNLDHVAMEIVRTVLAAMEILHSHMVKLSYL
jgi:hypothetical protein